MMIGKTRHNTRKMHSVPYLTKTLKRKWDEFLALADEFDRDHAAYVSLYTPGYEDVRNPGFGVSAEELPKLHVKILKEL